MTYDLIPTCEFSKRATRRAYVETDTRYGEVRHKSQPTPKRKYHHFDDIFIIVCTRICFDNLRFSKWQKKSSKWHLRFSNPAPWLPFQITWQKTVQQGLAHTPIWHFNWSRSANGSTVLIHLPLDKMAATLADNFKCIFLNENDIILTQFSLKFVTRSPLDNMPALVQVLA